MMRLPARPLRGTGTLGRALQTREGVKIEWLVGRWSAGPWPRPSPRGIWPRMWRRGSQDASPGSAAFGVSGATTVPIERCSTRAGPLPVGVGAYPLRCHPHLDEWTCGGTAGGPTACHRHQRHGVATQRRPPVAGASRVRRRYPRRGRKITADRPTARSSRLRRLGFGSPRRTGARTGLARRMVVRRMGHNGVRHRSPAACQQVRAARAVRVSRAIRPRRADLPESRALPAHGTARPVGAADDVTRAPFRGTLRPPVRTGWPLLPGCRSPRQCVPAAVRRRSSCGPSPCRSCSWSGTESRRSTRIGLSSGPRR